MIQENFATDIQGLWLAKDLRENMISEEKFALFLSDKEKLKFLYDTIRDDWFEVIESSAKEIGASVLKIAIIIGQKIEEVIIFNWETNKKGTYGKAVAWGTKNNLFRTMAHVPELVDQQYPLISKKFSLQTVYLIETLGYYNSEKVFSVWRTPHKSGSGFRPKSIFGQKEDLFIFSRRALP